MRYRVKFTFNGEQKFGVVEAYSKQAEAAKKRGLVLIADAVLPVSYEIPESEVVDIPYTMQSMGKWNPKTGDFEGGDEYEEYVRAEFKKAETRANLVKGVKPGAMFSIGVADGSAWYVITKVTKARATVEWRGFQGDRYYDHFFGGGRTLPLCDVEPYVRRHEAVRELFG
jgi:hypothetical protein